MTLTDVLPITALVAISIFLIKEVAEAFRRRNADKRKLSAIRLTVAEELQRNAFCHDRLAGLLTRMAKGDADVVTWSFEKDVEGRTHVLARYDDGSLASGSWLPKTSSSTYQKVFLEAAALDKKLFATISAAYDAVSEMDHIRGSMLDYLAPPMEHLPELIDFARWATESLGHIKTGMQDGYFACTGARQIPKKLR